MAGSQHSPEAGLAYAPSLSAGDMLRHFVALIMRNLWLIGSILAGAIALGLIATMLATPRYLAEAAIQIDDRSDSVLGDAVESAQDNAPVWDVERLLNTQLEVLRSRALAARVADRLDLGESSEFARAIGLDEGFANGRPAVIVGLQGNLKVDLPDNSRIARIGFASRSPEISAAVANAYAEELIQANLQRRFDSSAYAREFVSEQLEDARERLESSERELNDYARRAGLIRQRGEGAGGANVTGESLAQINEAANRAEAERIAAESRWRAASRGPLLSSQAAQSSPAVQSLVARMAELEAQLDTARERYLDDHPTVQRLEAELASTRSSLDRTARSARDAVRADYVAALDAEQQLDRRVAQLRGATLAEQDRSVRYNTLAREADINRTLYEGLLERYRGLNASAGIAASNIAIIDRAEPPAAPVSPNIWRNLIIALLGGLGLAGLVVFLRDQLDDTIRVPEDVEAKAGLPLLGVVPRAAEEDPLADLSDPASPLSEAYKALRGTLLYSTGEGLPRVLLVTSSQPTEGKSVTSFAAASALAQLGRKTVLVDADLRRPSVHKALGSDNKLGLSSVLVGDAELAAAIAETQEPNLVALTSGPLPPDPTRLLGSPRMAALLEQLAGRYDAVVIDSSPVLGLADAPMLAGICDATIFVIEADRGRSGSLKSALRRLRDANANLVGAVLTKFDPARASNRFSGYAGENYYRYDRETRADA